MTGWGFQCYLGTDMSSSKSVLAMRLTEGSLATTYHTQFETPAILFKEHFLGQVDTHLIKKD